MIEELAPILNLMAPQVAHLGGVFLRIGALVLFLPAFGERSLPVRVRLTLAIAMALCVGPLVTPPPLLGVSMGELILSIFTESMTGVFFGLLLRLFVISLQVAGTIAAQSTSLSQMLGPSAAIDPQPALSGFLVLAGLTFAVTLGLHVKLLSYAVLTYDLVPAGTLIDRQTVWAVGATQIGKCFYLGFSLSAPFLIASFIYNLILGFINKAMPQLMVSMVGAPAVIIGGIILMMLALPMILETWLTAFDTFMRAPGAMP